MTEGWKVFLWILAFFIALALGLAPILALLAAGYGWHAARNVRKGRSRAIVLV